MRSVHTRRFALVLGVAAAVGVAVVSAIATNPTAAQQPAAAAAQPKGAAPAGSNDHIMFGGSPDRNMINPKDKLEKFPKKGADWNDDEAAKKWSDEWILWRQDLG